METLEFALPVMNFRSILPPIILTITALLVLLAGVFYQREKSNTSFIGGISLAGSILAVISLFLTGPVDQGSSFSGMLLLDGFSFFFTLIVCLITIMTIMVSINYQNFFTKLNCGEYYCLLLIASVGMIFMGTSGHLVLLFVALETMSIAIYALAAFHKDQLRSLESALKYFLLGAFSSAFLLYGFAFIYGVTGTLDIMKIGRFLAENPDVLHSKLLFAGVLMMTAGFGFKISMVPFHMWTPDVYEGAPTSVTGFMATGVKAAAFAALIRFVLVPLFPLHEDWNTIMWIAAFLTMTVGNIVALVQDNVKRMLAYSSIAHAGYLLIGFVAGTDRAQTGMLYYLLAYAFMNIGAFGVVSLLGKADGEYDNISDFAGLGFKYPAMGVVMSIFMFSLAGIPPTAGFMGKFYIFTAAVQSGYVWLVIFGALNSIISIYYYLRVVVVMYFHTSEQTISIPSLSPVILLVLTIAGCAVLLMGLLPSYFWAIAQNSVFSMM